MKIALRAVILAALMTAAAGAASAADAPAKLKLGVYDTRAVAIAWARTPEFIESMRQFSNGDAAAEQKAQWMQVRLNQRAFSTAGAADLLKDRHAELAAIAKAAGVAAIVSKWEVPFHDGTVELVDVTMPVAGLFKPDEATLRILAGLTERAPEPFNELSLDPDE